MPEPQIRPEGPSNAKVFICGESPGEMEIGVGRPFVGPSGRVLDGLLRDAGIVRENCYITNTLLWKPDVYPEKDDSDLLQAIRELHLDIQRVNPNVILALGEHALRAVTGKYGIMNWRGSVLTSLTGHKCIPTIHPAAISREWRFRAPAALDVGKVADEALFSEIRRTEREYFIADPANLQETLNCIAQLKESPYVAFDIETEADQITSIAFAPSARPNWAICVPFWFGGSGSLWKQEDELTLWGAIRDLLTYSNTGKIAHNGIYDIEFIDRVMGFRVEPFVFDTMLGMHCLYLELPKSLAFAVSIYTDHPYYKADLHSKDMQVFARYNATDACLTMEIATKLIAELKEDKLWQFYQDYVHSLINPVMSMQKRGVKFDFLKRNSIKKNYQESVAVLQKGLDAAVGHPININSSKQMKEWLYGELGYKTKTKKVKGSAEERVTADEEALLELCAETGDERLKTVIKIREKQKVISTYLDVRLDEDKRIRCSYNISGTETGRFSSSATARGTGTNLQNVPAGPVKSLFLSDDGKVLINADLSQAEARVVAYLANESSLIRIFDEGGDIHRKNAANIFRVGEAEVTDAQRQLAKRVVHASNYGMGPITFSKQCNIPVVDAKRLLNQYFATYPNIANWQLDIAAQLRKIRTLVTPFGRKRTFFNRLNEQLTKEGLAFIPQSTVADIVGQALVCAEKKGIELLLQVHDSILCQCDKEVTEETAKALKECLTVPLEINGKILVIPVDIKTGSNWDQMEKWKGESDGHQEKSNQESSQEES